MGLGAALAGLCLMLICLAIAEAIERVSKAKADAIRAGLEAPADGKREGE